MSDDLATMMKNNSISSVGGFHEKPWVIIAVHKTVRELDGKLYLAMELLEKDFNVILGRSSALIRSAELLPKGIYCDIRHLITRKKHFERFVNAGSKVVAFDEEATSFTDPEEFARNHISQETVAFAEQCYTWGKHHHDTALGAVEDGYKDRFLCTSHPRFDMLREPGRIFYKNKVDELKLKFSSFILVTSNTGGWILSGDLDKKWQSYVSRGIFENSPENRDRFFAEHEYRVKRHQTLVSLVRDLAGVLPTKNIIIRPHFTETVSQWVESLGEVPENVKIIHEGPSIPWIMAAQAVIHSSCTSGTEAFLAGTPCISYRAIREERFDAVLPNSLSVEATTPGEVITLLEKWNAYPSSYDRDYRKPKLDLFDRYFAAREGETSSQRVAKAMSEISFTDQVNVERFENFLKRTDSGGIGRVAFQSLKNHVRSVIGSFKKRYVSSQPIEPEITLDMVEERIERLEKYMSWGDEKRLRVIDLGSEMFLLTLTDTGR